MYIKRRHSAFTLIEVLIFVVLTTMVVCAGAVLAHSFMRSVAFLTNSVDLDTRSRLAADRMTREIRNSDAIQSATANSLVLRLDGTLTTYTYDPVHHELSRDKEVILSGCDYVRFDLFQRNPATAAYDPNFNYTAAQPATCKIVQLNWVCSRYLLGFKANSTVMQSGKIMIRKQQQ